MKPKETTLTIDAARDIADIINALPEDKKVAFYWLATGYQLAASSQAEKTA